jgi:hypothetical protein
VCLKRGPVSLVRINEELLDRISSGFSIEKWDSVPWGCIQYMCLRAFIAYVQILTYIHTHTGVYICIHTYIHIYITN